MTKFSVRKSLRNGGMTLVEVLVVIALTSLLILVIATMIGNGFKGQKGVDNLLNTTGFMTEVKQLIWRGNICSENVRDILGVGSGITEGQVIPMTSIYATKNGVLDKTEPIFQVGHPTFGIRTGIKLNKIQIQVTKKISESFFIGRFNLDFSAQNQGFGASDFRRTFPIAISVDAGVFAYCGALDGVDGLVVHDEICGLSSEGELYWNGTMCVSKFETKNFDGSEDAATCPGGDWTVSSCFARNTGPPVAPVTGKYGKSLYPGALYFDVNTATNSCECDVLPTQTGICTAVCRRQIHFP